jgi:hypothetical protein
MNCCKEASLNRLNILIAGKSPQLHSLMLELHNLGHSVSIARVPKETLFIYAASNQILLSLLNLKILLKRSLQSEKLIKTPKLCLLLI